QKQLNTWVSFQSAEQPLLGQFSVSGNTKDSRIQGQVANARAIKFEGLFQDVIDQTRWGGQPTRALRQKTLDVCGRALTDIDAIGAFNSTLLPVSPTRASHTRASMTKAPTTLFVMLLQRWIEALITGQASSISLTRRGQETISTFRASHRL
ncbi:hypothetical protein ACP87_01190, partial [Pseudomonas oleovorans]